MTFDEAKTIFLNRGYIEVDGGSYFDGNKWRDSVIVISKWLKEEPCIDVLDKIRAEIIENAKRTMNDTRAEGLYMALKIVDRYKAESEG